MKKSFTLLCLALLGCLTCGYAQKSQPTGDLLPVERNVGKLNISIDPRIELLAAVHTLSGNGDLVKPDSEAPYIQDIKKYFGPFATHEAVAKTRSLRQEYGFAFDAPVAFMFHLTQPPTLKKRVDYSDYVYGRSGRKNNLEQYRKALKRFAAASDFAGFWSSKVPFYDQILDLMVAGMTVGDIQIDIVKIIEDYYNEPLGSYNLVITPAFYGGKGVMIPTADGKVENYSTASPNRIKDGIPYIDMNELSYYIFHEFSHSFVNPLTEKYADRVAASAALLEPIRQDMARQAYNIWPTVVNEHIIRAITIRQFGLLVAMIAPDKAEAIIGNLTTMELGNKFIYIEPLLEKLEEFEKLRDESGITFSEFYPRLLDVLDGLSAPDGSK